MLLLILSSKFKLIEMLLFLLMEKWDYVDILFNCEIEVVVKE